MNRLLLAAGALGALALLVFRPAPPPPAQASWSAAPRDAPGTEDARRPAGSASRAATAPARALAYIAGEVTRSGVYPVGPDSRVRDVLASAGGPRPGADLTAVNLAEHVRDGDAIVVPARDAPERNASGPRRAHGAVRHARSGHGRRGERRKRGRAASDAPAERGSRERHRGAAPAAVVDVNSADAETLATVPGIGDGLAERIVEFRRANGPFVSVDELLDVAGITEHRLDAMIPYVVAR